MAKKAVKRPHAADIRRGTKTREYLLQGVSDLRSVAATLDAIARRMEESGIAEINMDGQTKLDRGVALVREFNLLAKFALMKAENETGRLTFSD